MVHPVIPIEVHRRTSFESVEQETFLNIARTYGELAGRFDRLFKSFGISSAQYNILRILRRGNGVGLPILEVGEQMITRVPDMTRLVDRLEDAGYAERHRSTEDRRVILVRITDKGRELLSSLDGPTTELYRELLGHLSPDEMAELNRLLAQARQSAVG